jgi:uncharacterized protein YhfF
VPLAVIETTEVRVIPAADIDLEFAHDEGEGFETVDDWWAAHDCFWRTYVAGLSGRLTAETPVVAERFRLIEVS